MTQYTEINNVYFNGFQDSSSKTNLKTFNFNDIPGVNNSLANMFQECNNLTDVSNINRNVTNMYRTFRSCVNLVNAPVIPNSVVNLSQTFYQCSNLVNAPEIPSSVRNCDCAFWQCYNLTSVPSIPEGPNNVSAMFGYCNNLTSAPTIPASAVYMTSTFNGCTNLKGDVVIQSENVIYATDCFNVTNSSLQKNVYIPFKYANDVNTATYNSFTSAGYDNAGTQNGVYLKDLNSIPSGAFKFTTNTKAVGICPDEAYTLCFVVNDPETYSQIFTGYVDWNDVKYMTTIYNYQTGASANIYDVADEPYFEVEYYYWEGNDIPVYSDVDCTTQVGIFDDYINEGYIWFNYDYTPAGYTLGYLKTGYTASLTYTLPLSDPNNVWKNSGKTLVVSWGDGTTTRISGELTQEKLTHNYGVHDIYQISLGSYDGVMPNICFMDDSEAQEYLISIDTPLLDMIDKSNGIDDLFNNCINLESVCSGAFSNLTDIESARRVFYGCNGLFELPAGIMNIEGCYDFTDCFRNTKNLLFDDFFDTTVLENITDNDIIFDGCFAKTTYGRGEKGTIQELWNLSYQVDVYSEDTFKGNNVDTATNWRDVPEDWGGSTDITVTVSCSNDVSATIKINGVVGNTAVIKSGELFNYTITPSNLSSYIELNGIEYASGSIYSSTTQTISKSVSTKYEFGKFPTTGNNMPLKLTKLDNDLFINVPSGSSGETDGCRNQTLYKYNATNDRWYEANGIPADPYVTEGSYSNCAGVFKINGTFYAPFKNRKVYKSTDGYDWVEETGVSGLTSASFPDQVVSNGTIAVIKPYSGKLLWTTDGKTYTQCTGGGSGWIYTVRYLNGYFWFSQGNALYRSSDGKTFTKACTLSHDYYYLTYTGNRYFAQEYNNKYIYTSTDGVNWSSYFFDANTAGCVSNNGKYVTSLSYGTGQWTSTNGTTWGSKITNKGSINFLGDAIELGNGVFISGYYDVVYQYNVSLY